jgi:hypothetical protein
MDTQQNNAGRVVLKTQRQLDFPPVRLPKGYVRAAVLLMGVWLGLIVAMKGKLAAEGLDLPDLWYVIGRGAFWIAMVVFIAFASHTLWKLNHHQQQEERELWAHGQWLIDEAQRTFALEIQGAGLGMHGTALSDLWASLSRGEPVNCAAPSQRHEYSTRDWLYPLRRQAFRGSAAHAVTFWPIPTFVVGSLRPDDQQVSAAWMINEARNAALLGQSLFVSSFAERGNQAQAMIHRAFAFMDEQSQVPQILVVSDEEGASTEASVRANTCALLLSRADRLPPLAASFIETPTGEAFMKTAPGKLWTCFWQTDKAYAAQYQLEHDARHTGDVIIPRTMPARYWLDRIPTLLSAAREPGIGSFVPSLWLPVRWATFQLKAFETAPVLGYLHRPVTVAALPEAADATATAGIQNVASLKDGWIGALNSLPIGERPVRVFYDSTQHPAKAASLIRAMSELQHEGHGLDMTNAEEAFDIGQRIGNTGIGRTLLLINLATAASHEAGGVSAVVYTGEDHSTTFQMIRPPTAARKRQNEQREGFANPFTPHIETTPT